MPAWPAARPTLKGPQDRLVVSAIEPTDETVVCSENLIRVDDVMESLKLAE
jgi:hypothetical protein